MTTDRSENMVLRTVYLPKALDQRLRILAFQTELSKNELIRTLVQEALDIRLSTDARAQTLRPKGGVKATTETRIQRMVSVSEGVSASPRKSDKLLVKASPSTKAARRLRPA